MSDIVSDPTLIVSGAVKLIGHFEGLRLRAYADPASPLGKNDPEAIAHMTADGKSKGLNDAQIHVRLGAPWTIGYGSTSHPDGTPIRSDEVWTLDMCTTDLSRRVLVLLGEVGALVQVPLPDEAYAALMSLAYNCGIHVEERSIKNGGLLGKLNAADYAGAADCFQQYTHAGGKVLEALVTRRMAERAQFRSSCVTAGLAPSEDA